MFKRKDNQIDIILDDCLERILVNGESIEGCLALYRQYADELEPLLETAITARKAAMAIKPGADFKARARYQFHAALSEASTKKRGRFFNWQLKWVTATSLALTLMLSGGGVVAAASNSMPDSPLYSVKLATEQVQLFLASSPEGEAELYAKLVDRRVDEIVNMAGEGNAAMIEATTARMQDHLYMIATISANNSGNVFFSNCALTTVPTALTVTKTASVTVAEGGIGDSETLSIPTPTTQSIKSTTRTGEETKTLEHPGTVLPPAVTENDGGGFANQMWQQSNDNIAALNTALESASEEVKSALEEAIAALENSISGGVAPATTTVTKTVITTLP